MANPNPSSKDAQSAAEAKASKGAGRSSKAAKRASNGPFWHADADVSVRMGAALAGASNNGASNNGASNNPTCGPQLASRTRSPADSDPSGALSRKISG